MSEDGNKEIGKEADGNREGDSTDSVDTKDGNSESLSIVDEAKKVRDEIRAENDRREKILREEQKLRADNLLGGTTGGHVENKPKEQTDHEYREEVEKGIREGKYL